MAREARRDASVLLLTRTQDFQRHASGFEPPYDTIEYETLDAVGIAAAPSTMSNILTETTANLIDDAFLGGSSTRMPQEQRKNIMMPASKIRKAKAPTLRDSDWEPHKDRILELYSQQNMDAQSLQRILSEERGFHAEYALYTKGAFVLADIARLRQYETPLKKWKLGKYIKHREMAAIVRKMQHRTLIEVDKGDLTFEVRNKPVEIERIRRWMRTHDVASDDLYAQSPPARKCAQALEKAWMAGFDFSKLPLLTSIVEPYQHRAHRFTAHSMHRRHHNRHFKT